MSDVEIGDVKLKRSGIVLTVYECTGLTAHMELGPSGHAVERTKPVWTEVGYIEFDPCNPNPGKIRTSQPK